MNKISVFVAICALIIVELTLILPVSMGIMALIFLDFDSFSMNPTGLQLNPIVWVVKTVAFIGLGFAIINLRKSLIEK